LSGHLPAEGRKNFFDEGCSVTLTWKGLEIEFAKIQIALKTLVLFCNKFTRMILVSIEAAPVSARYAQNISILEIKRTKSR